VFDITLSGVQLNDLGCINVKAKGLISLGGIAKGQRETDIAEADNADGGGGG
jgi:hypothetical protein